MPLLHSSQSGEKKILEGAKNLGEKNSCVGVKARFPLGSWGVGPAVFVGGLSGPAGGAFLHVSL